MPSLAPRMPFTCLSMSSQSLQLDLDVDAGRQVEAHERVDGLGGRVDDVDQSLVRTHLEVLARVLVLVRRADHAVAVDLSRQRHGASHLRTGARDRLDNLARRGVHDLVVVGLEPDADLLSRHGGFCFLLSLRSLTGDQRRRPDRPPGQDAAALSDPRGRACRAAPQAPPRITRTGAAWAPDVTIALRKLGAAKADDLHTPREVAGPETG